MLVVNSTQSASLLLSQLPRLLVQDSAMSSSSEVQPWQLGLKYAGQLLLATANPSNVQELNDALEGVLQICEQRNTLMSQPTCRKLVNELKVC